MDNKNKQYIEAMHLLGTTNILKTLAVFTAWILNPDKAINVARKILYSKKISNGTKANVIGYINEFFSKYITFGKKDGDIVKINQIVDKGGKTNNKLIKTLIELREMRNIIKKKNKGKDQVFNNFNNKSFGVSGGITTGKILNINSPFQSIPDGCVGVFPTSGTKYTQQFFKCKGMIFLNGAMTSHGAIIARENNIPAIVYPNLKINDNKIATIDGLKGTLKIVDNDK